MNFLFSLYAWLNSYFYRPQRSLGKVIFSQASVILSTGEGGVCSRGVPGLGGVCSWGGAWSRGCLLPGGCAWSWGGTWWTPLGWLLLLGCLVWGGCLLLVGGVWSWGVSSPSGCAWSRGVPGPGGCLVENPRDGYCCRRYASYWNAFLFPKKFQFSYFLTILNAAYPTSNGHKL